VSLHSGTAEYNLEEQLEKSWRRPQGAEWLRTQERRNPELVDIFGAKARYRRAKVGSSYDDAHPDNSTLHMGKIYSFPLHISGLFFSFCDSVEAPRQRPGHHDQAPATHNERRRGQRPGHHDK
jgi:hypothetical protein